MRFKKATRKYETWLKEQTKTRPEDLELKHAQMRLAAFPFLRATFYRWIQLWPEVCPDLESAPTVLAVGDLHVENFGTWRDIEGRLVWGINDFDEAYRLPYTLDLVRLAASALLAIGENHLAISDRRACDAILSGYAQSLHAGGGPFILAENHSWLRKLAMGELRDPVRFWQRMDALPVARSKVPRSALRALEALMPERGLELRIATRVAGLGSLGRQRYVALADWHGGKIAREAKALLPSACVWASSGKGKHPVLYQTILDHSVRCRDPFVHLEGTWIVRRLAPDCSRIELSALPKGREENKLLRAMGWETANIHAGSRDRINAVLKDLRKRPGGWLLRAAGAMAKATVADWQEWKSA